MNARITPFFAFIGCLLAFADAPAGGKSEYGLAVGQKLPFHVVDFHSGPKTKAGCPSVMISNAKTRGIVLWARTSDDKFFELAKRLQEPLGKVPEAQGYLALFEKPGDLSAQAKKHGVEKFTVGIMRGQSQTSMITLGALKEVDINVFFLDLKTVKATWSLKAKDLDQEASDKIVAAAEKFFQAKDEEKK
jgi:hypothetical protein